MAILDDAVELVVWYESQPDCGTYKSDSKIAERLGWVIGGMTAPKRLAASSSSKSGLQPKGDAGRVRRARRFVDQHNDRQPFLGYAFGTKTNGAGVKFSMLITPRMGNAIDAMQESSSEQMRRAVQQTEQAAAERARMIAKFNEDEAAYITAGKFEHALVIHDAAKELQMFGQLTMATLQQARHLGILSRFGAEA